MEKVSLKKLLIAYSIDIVILTIIINVFWMAMGWLLWQRIGSIMSWIMPIMSLAIYVAYFVFFECYGGKTLGKKIAELQTVAADGGNLACWRVLGAYTIDLALLLVFMRIFWWLAVPLSEQIIRSCVDPYKCLFVRALIGTLIDVAIYVVYFVIPEHITGKTLGKKLMGLAVVQETKELK